VLNESNQPIPGLYVSGWLKRGPVGIIDSTLRDSVDTFRIMKHHLENDLITEKKTSIEEVTDMLSSLG
jgi:ferredoxin--NADP+ reductase